MTDHKNNRLEKEFATKNGEQLDAVLESNNEIQNLAEGIDSSVMEKVSAAAGENKAIAHTKSKKTKKNIFDFSAVSNQIKNLLPKTAGMKKIVLPTREIQVKLVEKSLKMKQKKLLAQADKIVGSKKFSASKLESIISQIRYIQNLLQELVNAASKTIEKLYKKFVLKTG